VPSRSTRALSSLPSSTSASASRSRDRARRRRELSQNLLADRATVHRFARAAGTGAGGLIVEPGAGDGRVTRALAVRADRVLAYEIDPRMAARLAARCGGLGNVECVTGDFLAAVPPRGPFHVAGNIPYAATSRIVEWCLRAPGLRSATLITQLEYARKRTGGYGRWSLVTVRSWPVFQWRLLERIERGRFRPVPRVDAAVLRLDRRERPLLPARELAAYERCVAVGFGGRGGTLHASLRREYPRGRVDAAFRAAALDRSVVVAFVHPDQWITLFRVLHGLQTSPYFVKGGDE
jgi:23S rRNA (adenine-N6)-dimethyltransferase